MAKYYRRRRRKNTYQKKGRKLEGYEFNKFVYQYEWLCVFVFLGVGGVFAYLGGTSVGELQKIFFATGGGALLFGIIFVIRFSLRKRFLHRFRTIVALREMDPIQFEYYIAHLLEAYGFRAKVTQGVRDFGVDVIAKKDGKTHVVQCKRYAKSHKVASPEMRDFLGSIAHWKADHGIFVTTSRFTEDAQIVANKNNIRMIDEAALADIIAEVYNKKNGKAL